MDRALLVLKGRLYLAILTDVTVHFVVIEMALSRIKQQKNTLRQVMRMKAVRNEPLRVFNIRGPWGF